VIDDTRSEKRPLVAAAFALIYPGLGHVYLREWLRAMIWFGLVLTSSVLLIPESAVPDTYTVDAFVSAARSMPPDATIALLSITVFSMLDAYWMAKRSNEAATVTDASEVTTCPNCGKELDEDIDFCHWCTEPLDASEE